MDTIFETVLDRGLCVGCGMCAGIQPDCLRMVVDRYGAYVPELISADVADGWQQSSLGVCPFADRRENEDAIATRLFAHQRGVQHRSETGYFLECFAGHVTDEAYRLTSTSGGLITWLIGDLLAAGLVDAAVCVGLSKTSDTLFEYQVIRDPAELEQCKKSRYYPIEVSQVIPQIRASKDRVVFVGLPCFVKALRLAMKEDDVLRERIAYTIGLFCGHLKTRHYTHYLSRCCGVPEKDIVTVDFRQKKIGGGRNGQYSYDFEVTAQQDGQRVNRRISMGKVFASSWSFNLFMLNACDYCDDVLAETADVAIGDAWLPEYMKDWRGTNMVIVRSQAMLERLHMGMALGRLHLESLSVSKVIQSADPCLRHRREGLAYRLYLAQKRGQATAHKRMKPDGDALNLFRRVIQRLRIKTRALSHEVFVRQQQASDGVDVFIRALRPWVVVHDQLYRAAHIGTRWKRRLMQRSARA